MFCGNAAGEFIPPMAVYRSEHCYENWTIGGYNNKVYDCTANGWFDSHSFEMMVFLTVYSEHKKTSGKTSGLDWG